MLEIHFDTPLLLLSSGTPDYRAALVHMPISLAHFTFSISIVVSAFKATFVAMCVLVTPFAIMPFGLLLVFFVA